eukprot:1868388-Prorocentrum_lima.AAC.1
MRALSVVDFLRVLCLGLHHHDVRHCLRAFRGRVNWVGDHGLSAAVHSHGWVVQLLHVFGLV